MAWLESLKTPATNEAPPATNAGKWVELVKVKKWYSLRVMRWDATNKEKKYERYIGTLENAKKDPIYGDEARRLERRRFGGNSGAPSPDTGALR